MMSFNLREKDSITPCFLGMGFLAYAKINPFAAAAGNAFAQLSPRSPKNPFQTTSPAHNPFMSFVDKKEEYWKMMSTNPSLANTSSMFGFTSDTVANTLINSRSIIESVEADGKQSKFGNQKLSGTPGETRDSIAKEKLNSEGNSPISEEGSESCSPGKPPAIEPEPSANVANGEEGEECVFQVRAKLFRLGTKETQALQKPALSASQQSDLEITADDKIAATENDDIKIGKSSEEREKETKTGNCVSEPKTTIKDDSQNSNSDVKIAAPISEWVEVGTGPLRVLRPSSSTDNAASVLKVSYPRVVMRRECQPGGNGTKLILNELLHGHTAVSKMGDKAVRLTVISMFEEKAQPVTYLLKTKLTTVRSNAEY